MWVSRDPQKSAGKLWAHLLKCVGMTKLYPILLMEIYIPENLRGRPEMKAFVQANSGRPWHSGELSPAEIKGIDDVEPGIVLARWWRDKYGGRGLDARGLPGAIPLGFAGPPVTSNVTRVDPDDFSARIVEKCFGLAELTGRDDSPFLGLVPAADGASAIVACGWLSRAGDVTDTAAVIRSWQRRFGARLCVLGMDLLVMTVAWPPGTREEARQVALEHDAFSDIIDTDIDTYAAHLVNCPVWRFWWDLKNN